MKNILTIIFCIILLEFYGCKTEESGSSHGIPNAPSNLTASTVSTSKIKLEWDDNSNIEDGIIILRSTTDSYDEWYYERIAKLSQTDITSYVDTNLARGTTYYYLVKSYNGDYRSAASNRADATTYFIMIHAGSSGGHDTLIACGYLGIEPLFLIFFIILLRRHVMKFRKHHR
jgi:fibronectin type 3 domain-containing protein